MKHLIGATIFCISTDGEARRGKALVLICYLYALTIDDPLFPILSPLPFFNTLTGKNRLTADKDYKHVFKRERSLIIRSRGTRVLGIDLTPAVFQRHLEIEGMAKPQMDAFFAPDDKQDVTLAINLLKSVWSLERVVKEPSPGLAEQREGIYIFGRLLYYAAAPYLNVSMSLRDQLRHLSAAAHLLMYLYAATNAKSTFMPPQLYTDMQIMIKNVYFSVAKARELDPNAMFFIILLGTDRLEVAFGILRTMIGNNCHADILQMGSRFSNIVLVMNILAEHPEWHSEARRLHLPGFDSTAEFSAKIDHINPASWKGDVQVKDVVLLTEWMAGRAMVEDLVPEARDFFLSLERSGGDIFHPFGGANGDVLREEDEREDDEMEDPRPEEVEVGRSGGVGDIDLEDLGGIHQSTRAHLAHP